MSKETPWTPGPWTMKTTRIITAPVVAPLRDGRTIAFDKEVAHVLPSGSWDRHANASLIAAAPEMAEALRKIAEITRRQQLPITAQINEIAISLLAKINGDNT